MPKKKHECARRRAKARQQCPRRKPGATACFLPLGHSAAFKRQVGSQCACQRREVQFASATEPSSGCEAGKSAQSRSERGHTAIQAGATMVKRRKRWLARCLTDRLPIHLVWTSQLRPHHGWMRPAFSSSEDKKMPLPSTNSHTSFGRKR